MRTRMQQGVAPMYEELLRTLTVATRRVCATTRPKLPRRRVNRLKITRRLLKGSEFHGN